MGAQPFQVPSSVHAADGADADDGRSDDPLPPAKVRVVRPRHQGPGDQIPREPKVAVFDRVTDLSSWVGDSHAIGGWEGSTECVSLHTRWECRLESRVFRHEANVVRKY